MHRAVPAAAPVHQPVLPSASVFDPAAPPTPPTRSVVRDCHAAASSKQAEARACSAATHRPPSRERILYSAPSAARSSPSALGADVETTVDVAYLLTSPPSASTCPLIHLYVICTAVVPFSHHSSASFSPPLLPVGWPWRVQAMSASACAVQPRETEGDLHPRGHLCHLHGEPWPGPARLKYCGREGGKGGAG